MEYSCVQLNDLPYDILMIIFKKLNNVGLLYSLMDINIRLNKILYDSIFTETLTLIRLVPSRLNVVSSISKYFLYPLLDPMLDRFCLHILPKIHQKILWLNLESLSMQRILLATSYPNLYGLGLYNIERRRAIQLLSDDILFNCSLKKQILSLFIDFHTNGEVERVPPIENVNAHLFVHIFTIFTNLQHLYFGPSSTLNQYFSFRRFPPNVNSSTLLELHICLNFFTDCLYLLDGRFNQLRILHINIDRIARSTFTVNNEEKLPNLTSFSLCCDTDTDVYNELIVPLLHRMSNLEKLHLSILVWTETIFVDGNILKRDIISRMPRLNKFTFNIRSFIYMSNEINLQSNEDIKETFKDFKDDQIISFVDYFPKRKINQCHIYSYPYKLKYYNDITNNFSGGLFNSVYEVSLVDEQHPFEHKFFLQISQSFPLLEKLTVINQIRQNNKQFRKSKNENENLSIIEYPYLAELNLIESHQDYYEQFLYNTKTCLPNGICVHMDYRTTKKVTRNFRRNITRNNCAKISYVYFYRTLTFPEHLKNYFPYAQIL